ncbi:hypothetical protein [Nitrospina watsonii]|uniref:Uncharacterized protein n=1 Tax=Nitrospina watsonii TaxID=1323948 RepID=A0ABM9HEL2_9BACT|nr:hypothetical protein [Nitrospina watsonii]CAI2718641.1 conserved protein of unknown function [Nitrospina watsonii]
MPFPDFDAPSWSALELRLIRERELFLHKHSILKKAEEHLELLKQRMLDVLADDPGPVPLGTDLKRGKLTRGENNKGFPFLSLDIPQFFTREEYFTYRVLFWWGHYLGYSLVLKGEALPGYLACLKTRRHEPEFADIWIARHSSPWEWENADDNFAPVQQPTDEDLDRWIGDIQYIKVIRMIPLTTPGFPEVDWAEEGVRTYRDLMRLTQK